MTATGGRRMAGFRTGLAIGAIGVGVLGYWWVDRVASEPISFPGKTVYVTPDYLVVEGSVVGDERMESDRPVNNLAKLVCRKERQQCEFQTVNELAPRHVGGLDEETLDIRKWDAREMVADSLGLSSNFEGCNYYEIRVLFDSEDVTYTRLPNPRADKKRCDQLFKNSTPLRQWRIDDGKGAYGYEKGEA